MASLTFIRFGSTADCSWTPTRCRTASGSRAGSRPRTRTLPASGVRSPIAHSTVVVLPAPWDPQRDRVQRDDGAVLLGDIGQFDHVLVHDLSLSSDSGLDIVRLVAAGSIVRWMLTGDGCAGEY